MCPLRSVGKVSSTSSTYNWAAFAWRHCPVYRSGIRVPLLVQPVSDSGWKPGSAETMSYDIFTLSNKQPHVVTHCGGSQPQIKTYPAAAKQQQMILNSVALFCARLRCRSLVLHTLPTPTHTQPARRALEHGRPHASHHNSTRLLSTAEVELGWPPAHVNPTIRRKSCNISPSLRRQLDCHFTYGPHSTKKCHVRPSLKNVHTHTITK